MPYIRHTYVVHTKITVALFVTTAYQRRTCSVFAYQWRMCYVCATHVSLLWSMCDVLGVFGIFCGVSRES